MTCALRILIVSIILLFELTLPKPAFADWGAGRTCGTHCPDPGIVCDEWAALFDSRCLVIGPPLYDDQTGRISGMHLKFINKNGSIIDTWTAGIYCTAPKVADGLVQGACSEAVAPPRKQLGCGCDGQSTAGNPISINIGNKFETAIDFNTEGQKTLSFIRYYNSQLPRLSSLGWGWRSNFDRGFGSVGGSGSSAIQVTFTRADGATWVFSRSGSTWTSTDKDVNAKLVSLGSAGWVLTDSRDNVETYTLDGHLSSIKDRSGYIQNLAYDSDGNLTSVVDSFGRALTFTFSNGSIHTMTDPDGNVYTYNYSTLFSGNDKLVSVIFPGGNSPTVQYLYEDTSYPYALTGIVDENGQRYATWAYDSTLRAISSQHGAGADLTTLSYNLASNGTGTVTTTNALGKQRIYTLSLVAGAGKITKIVGVASAHTPSTSESFSYDNNGYTASHTDDNGNVTTYVNDARGNIISETDGFGSAVARTISTTWDAIYNVPTKIVQPGLTTEYSYSGGLLTQKKQTDTTTSTVPYSTNGSTRTWTYNYFPTGLLQSVNGPGGATDVVSYTYDQHGCAASFTNQVGQVTTITSANGRCQPLASVDVNGVTTTYAYDNRGRVTLVTINPGPHQSTTGYGYDLAGNLTSTTLPDGSSLGYTYDDAHRLTGLANNLGEYISYTLDALGNRTAEIAQSASSTITKQQSATFDELGRVTATIGAAAQTTQHAYDANDNEITTTDPRGKVYGNSFDALNRLHQAIDPSAAKTTIAYNGQDQVTGVTDARALATTYVRNGFGDPIQRTSPDTGTEVYWYNGNGNVVKKIDARGIETDFTYDAANRALTKSFPTAPTENVTYGYDATTSGNLGVGRLTSVTDQSGASSLIYDALGQVITDKRIIGSQSYSTQYSYDAAGKILTATYPSGRIINFTRDTLGRISSISTQLSASASAAPLVTGVAYEPYGPLSSMTFGNGLTAALTFDKDYQLTGIKVSNGETSILNVANTFDPSGNITSIKDNAIASRDQTLSYDDLNRVASANGQYGVQSYTYDAVGNRLTRTINATTETYAYASTSNKLTAVTTAVGSTRNFTYAASGQVTQDSRDPSAMYVFNVNANGRNAGASLNGSTVGSYLYNDSGQRVQKAGEGGTTQFLYDLAGHLLEEASASGVPLREYVWLDDLPVAMVETTSGSSSIFYIHTDQLGTPRLMTDGSANIAWENSSDPFGNAVMAQVVAGLKTVSGPVASLSLNNLRYPGQYFDSETGLAQNWFRDYDSSIGRYIQSDSIGLTGGINTYAYVDGNPVSRVDPTGRFVILVPFIPPIAEAIGAGIGAYLGWNVLGPMLGKDSASDPMESSMCSSRPKNPPDVGPPNGWVQGPRRGRQYGPDGRPTLDIDKPHQGNEQDHAHEWPNGVREEPGRPVSPWPQTGGKE
ncbi:RHS repeat domain-containing protein [Burkholderia gladioli]|uniref:RHS repeat domain-containing protein n=1 Tax=Burkholderia gladioli TaxID=28095 RepID=UPI0016403009|nr:RHS repeat-associated core domain-containing protein [Burkholderia gladioli]